MSTTTTVLGRKNDYATASTISHTELNSLVNDLERSRLGWWAAYVGTRLVTRSPMVHFDGVVSVEGAFTADEALAVARQAGLDGATVRRKFPFRYLLSWRRP